MPSAVPGRRAPDRGGGRLSGRASPDPGAGDLRWPTVLFDLDGTLVEPEEGITRGIQVALAAVDVHVDDRTELRRYIGPPLQDAFGLHHGLVGERLDVAVTAYKAYFDAEGYAGIDVHEGVPALLGALRAAGARLAVATSKPEVRALRVLDHAGLMGAFDVVAGATEDGSRRHKVDIVVDALARLAGEDGPPVDRPAHDGRAGDGRAVPRAVAGPAVLVGDRDLDVVGARAAGIDAVAVRWGHAAPGELEAAGPAAVVATVAELATVLGVPGA